MASFRSTLRGEEEYAVTSTDLETVSRAEITTRASSSSSSNESFRLSTGTSLYSVKSIASVSSNFGITIPESSITATCLPLSSAMNIITLGRMQMAAKKIGPRKVMRRNDFFLTRVRYSRAIIVFRFLIFMAYSSSVTSLMNMSFMRGTSSLNEFTATP